MAHTLARSTPNVLFFSVPPSVPSAPVLLCAMIKSGPELHRPYDVAIPTEQRLKVIERRRSPDGLPHPVPEVRRGSQRVYSYPWSKLQIGDFFIVRAEGRSVKAMKVAFYQAAARHDYEVVVSEIVHEGIPSLRVTLTVIGVNRYKAIAEDKHDAKGVTYSDGRWKARRREYRQAKNPAKTKVDPKNEEARPAFWADHDPELLVPISKSIVAPEVHRTKEEIRRRALELAGKKR